MQKTVCRYLVPVLRNLWQKFTRLKKTDLRISHSSSESPIESEIEMEPPADQLRKMAFDRRNKNWLEESWNLIDTIEKNNKGRQSVIIKQETLQEVREKG